MKKTRAQQRMAAYGRVRQIHMDKREHISSLTWREYRLRQAIKRNTHLFVVEWESESEGTLDGEPVWFWYDALCWVVEGNKWTRVYIDLRLERMNKRNKRTLRLKQRYAKANNIPLLVVRATENLDAELMVFTMKVRKGWKKAAPKRSKNKSKEEDNG